MLQARVAVVVLPDGSCATAGTCAINTVTQLLTEGSSNFSLAGQTTWYVFDKLATNADGRRVGYEITPKLGGVWRGRTAADEAWSAGDLWVTRFNGCERYAARNQGPQQDPGCTAPPANLAAMVNGQSVDGADIVAWYVQRVQHVPRDEDDPVMPIEWTSFEIKPRNFHHVNP